MSSHIRIVQGYRTQPDGPLIASAGTVIQGLTGNARFANPPVDLKTAQAALDELIAAIAAQPNGGPAATAHKKNKRSELIAILSRLAHFVQDTCEGDVAAVLNAGFTVVSSSRATSALHKPAIANIDFGNTTQLVIRVTPVERARCYEVEAAAIGAGGVAEAWRRVGLYTNSRAITVTGLTPLTTYVFQVRAVGGSTGCSDWSDAVSHICV
jgi:hypothetical protein